MVFPEDGGRYTLVAENQHGRAQSEAELHVNEFSAPIAGEIQAPAAKRPAAAQPLLVI